MLSMVEVVDQPAKLEDTQRQHGQQEAKNHEKYWAIEMALSFLDLRSIGNNFCVAKALSCLHPHIRADVCSRSITRGALGRIPHDLRPLLWEKAAMRCYNDFGQPVPALPRDNRVEAKVLRWIENDVTRIMPQLDAQMVDIHDDLVQVLTFLVQQFPEIGYRAGMGYLVARILQKCQSADRFRGVVTTASPLRVAAAKTEHPNNKPFSLSDNPTELAFKEWLRQKHEVQETKLKRRHKEQRKLPVKPSVRQCYLIMCGLFDHWNLKRLYSQTASANETMLCQCMRSFEELLSAHEPTTALHARLQHLGVLEVITGSFGAVWFTTLFTENFPEPLADALLDRFILGPHIELDEQRSQRWHGRCEHIVESTSDRPSPRNGAGAAAQGPVRPITCGGCCRHCRAAMGGESHSDRTLWGNELIPLSWSSLVQGAVAFLQAYSRQLTQDQLSHHGLIAHLRVFCTSPLQPPGPPSPREVSTNRRRRSFWSSTSARAEHGTSAGAASFGGDSGGVVWFLRAAASTPLPDLAMGGSPSLL
jgi:hypothetical protein